MNNPLAFAVLAEGATGLALIVAPSLVGQLLLGTELSGVANVIGRVTGIALLALGVACWPGLSSSSVIAPAVRAMLAYNLMLAIYLVGVGIRGEWVGKLLWPAAALHALLTLLLARPWIMARRP